MNSINTHSVQAECVRDINNFLFSYAENQCLDNLNKLFDYVTAESSFKTLNESEKERILDFLESLEELLPAIYTLTERKSGSLDT